MTDVPAVAMSFLSLWHGRGRARGEGRCRRQWLVGSLIAGAFAFSIREVALAAPVSVIVAAILTEPDPAGVIGSVPSPWWRSAWGSRTAGRD